MTKLDQNGLTERQRKALPFFIASSSEAEACRQANVSKQTYYGWLKEPFFKEELERLRSKLADDAISILKANVSKAVDVLVLLLEDANSHVKRGAANDILNHASKFKEMQEFEQRIENLERRHSHAKFN